ncbi:hypothetical protein ACJIZ3_022199 [Penstemon smallii]|uniref:DCD domain-containing protein n=1 Tax=Penstemon smallii TaxID=265156 RepID=A0ABD3SNX9_9LAMI
MNLITLARFIDIHFHFPKTLSISISCYLCIDLLTINVLNCYALTETPVRIQPKIFILNEPSSPWMASNVAWTRNLKKHQLGGVIFGCTSNTIGECLSNKLFGLPSSHFLYIKNIEPGLPLFLFNYSERKLHGIYEAASSGKMNIDSYAWTADGSEKTKYSAQVQIRVRLQCQALAEDEFKPIIADNYYSKFHFWFELDHAQATKLIAKISSLPVVPGTFLPKSSLKWTAKQRLSSDNRKEESQATEPSPLKDDFDNPHDSIATSATSDDFLYFDGNSQFVEASLSNQMVDHDEKDLIYMKLKELALSSEYADANMIGRVVEAASEDDVDLKQETLEDTMMALGETNGERSFDPNYYPTIISKMYREMEELKAFKQEQTRNMGSMEKKLVILHKTCLNKAFRYNPFIIGYLVA